MSQAEEKRQGRAAERKSYRHGALAVVLVVALAGVGCGEGEGGRVDGDGLRTSTTEEPVLTPKAGGKLSIGLVAETDGWNPAKNRWGASGIDISWAIFDKLA